MSDDDFDGTLALARRRVGTTLNGKWYLDRLLGVGGMAAVYEATHRNRKRAAIKILHPEFSQNLAVRQRFLREGYVANSVGQAGAVSVDDDDVAEDGCAFLVMELLDGETLDARWERKGKHLPAAEVLSLMDQVLSTLTAAHTAGIVHRDLKPENLFFTRSGAVKVLDFGIARVRELSQSSTKTQTGSMMGTPSFMPPEQARGRWDEVDGQSDLWAIGATMFTLLSGHYVHEASTVNEALAFAVTTPARSIATLVPELRFPIVELVDRALAYEKASRWSSAASMQAALRRAYAGLEAAALAAGEAPLKPITLEGFDDDTVATPPGQSNSADPGQSTASGAAHFRKSSPQLDPDIPPSPTPVIKASALTTARGLAQSALEQPSHQRSRIIYVALGVLIFVAVIWVTRAGIHGERPAVATPSTTDATALPGNPSTPSTALPRASVASDTPARVSLEELPVAARTLPQSAVRKLNQEGDARREPSSSSTAAQPPVRALPSSRPTLIRNPYVSDDPFASRK